ncbi:MAG: T9SS type A sorting domain-containing protein [Sporocytophaga sp.]|uniref:T9SS type A sorting domain-containing protein n=1 Tax=Sporocytophaga sp. TaxID=2231183 RepID=UPI001B2ECDEA|nr:T9SS type A sorting domain-containing protein [Sporocytophaga sp.]MBO9702588.1 T9SS type A sorting domain-containing protein [Sporocytophaga sp.]
MKTLLLSTISFSLFLFSNSYSQKIIPDNGFGINGKVTIDIDRNDETFSSCEQKDGKILIAATANHSNTTGVTTVLRLLSDGSLDPSFGGNGKVSIPFGSEYSRAFSIAERDDHKILVAASFDSDKESTIETYLAVARLNSDGSLDNSFDDDGMLLISAGTPRSQLKDFILLPDNKMLLSGISYDPNIYDFDIAVVKLNEDGSFDNSFNNTGKLIITNSDHSDHLNKLFIRDNGQIMLLGQITKDKDYCAVIRINSNGTLDNSFGENGIVLIPQGVTNDFRDLAVDEDGTIYIAGSYSDNFFDQMAVISLNDNGSLNANFSDDGLLNFKLSDFHDSFSTILIKDGKLLLGGITEYNSKYNIALVRLDKSGNFDNTFEDNGIYLFESSTVSENINQMFFQSDQKLLLLGGHDISILSTDGDILLYRVNYPITASLPNLQAFDQDFLIFPNPSSGIINIKAPRQKGYIEVKDLTGKIHTQFDLSQKPQTFEISDLSQGIYIVTLLSEKGEYLKNTKVVVY